MESVGDILNLKKHDSARKGSQIYGPGDLEIHLGNVCYFFDSSIFHFGFRINFIMLWILQGILFVIL
jgi:hypothetical protein